MVTTKRFLPGMHVEQNCSCLSTGQCAYGDYKEVFAGDAR